MNSEMRPQNPCQKFETLTNFEDYIDSLRDTYQNITADAMEGCKKEICTTVYGTGNSDVSGIGVSHSADPKSCLVTISKVIIGYYVEFGLAIILSLLLLLFNIHKHNKLARSTRKITAAYADSAIMLALSVELACAIVLIRKNFGLGSYDFGALTVQIAWTVAVLIILPIVNFCWQDLGDDRFELRLCMIGSTFILFLINFISRMISRFSNRQKGTAYTDDEGKQLAVLCLLNSGGLSSIGQTVIDVFCIGGSLWTSFSVVAALADQCLYAVRNTAAKKLHEALYLLKDERRGLAVNVVALMIWSFPQFWALMKFRASQKQFATNLGQADGSDEWSFGQILAVVVFLPVFVEVVQQYIHPERN